MQPLKKPSTFYFNLWDSEYKAICKKEIVQETREAVKYILAKNVVCGNALTLMCVDENQQDTKTPIIFSEWSLMLGTKLKRRDFRLDVMLKENENPEMYDTQLSIFGDVADGAEYWMLDSITHEPIPRPIKEYPPVHYRMAKENE